MSYKWELFTVGMKREEWKGLPDGMQMEWADICGLTLFVYYNDPQPAEIVNLSVGSDFEIRFKDINGIGFFAVKFGEQPWGDCAFCPNLYKETPAFVKLGAGATYALNVMLIDTANGELKMLRTIGLGKAFAERFRKWCVESLKKNISNRYYLSVVDEAFKEFTTSEELAKAADFVWVCPHGEETPRREEKNRE